MAAMTTDHADIPTWQGRGKRIHLLLWCCGLCVGLGGVGLGAVPKPGGAQGKAARDVTLPGIITYEVR